MHHLYFNYKLVHVLVFVIVIPLTLICSYGQFTTLWDRLGGSYRKPNDELFKRETKMSKDEWSRQQKEMEKTVKEVEGDDDRVYLPDAGEKKSQ